MSLPTAQEKFPLLRYTQWTARSLKLQLHYFNHQVATKSHGYYDHFNFAEIQHKENFQLLDILCCEVLWSLTEHEEIFHESLSLFYSLAAGEIPVCQRVCVRMMPPCRASTFLWFLLLLGAGPLPLMLHWMDPNPIKLLAPGLWCHPDQIRSARLTWVIYFLLWNTWLLF